MTNKEKEYIKALGKLYVKTGKYELGCGSNEILKEVNILKYLKECEYNDKLETYMKYRNAQRYTKEWTTCGGRDEYMSKNSLGEYVKCEKGYFNIRELENELRPQDILAEIQKLQEKYKNAVKFSWNPNIMPAGSFVPDMGGDFIYDEEKQTFIDISK